MNKFENSSILITSLSYDQIISIINEVNLLNIGNLEIACINSPKQIVLCGNSNLIKIVKEKYIKQSIVKNVTGPVHTTAMLSIKGEYFI